VTSGYDWGERLPTLTAQRVELRWLEDGDVPALFALFGDPQVTRYWAWPAYRDRAQAAALLEEIRAHFRKRTLFQWGIARQDDGAVIGTATLLRLDPAHRRAEVGYALARPCWGQGLAAEAVAALVGFAFGPLGLHRLEAGVDLRNERSLRLLARLGFQREGTLRERFHFHGELQDDAVFGLLRHEWRGLG